MTDEDGALSKEFQPALPMRGVTEMRAKMLLAEKFQPALPMRGVTCRRIADMTAQKFQPALPMRGVTEYLSSIAERLNGFQPALPMRGVTPQRRHICPDDLFQPALPMRGVTLIFLERDLAAVISTRTPHAGSDRDGEALAHLGDISTRTPHAGSDGGGQRRGRTATYFNPHSPCGE